MSTKQTEVQKKAKKMLHKYKVSRFNWTFKQFFFTFLWAYICYLGFMPLYKSGFHIDYYSYFVLIVGLISLRYGLKWVISMIIWLWLKSHLVDNWVAVEARIVNVEYIDSWSTYQKGSFIFAVPQKGLLEGLNIIFKSERILFKIPKWMLKPWDTVLVFVDPKDLHSYWMNIESIFKKHIKN